MITVMINVENPAPTISIVLRTDSVVDLLVTTLTHTNIVGIIVLNEHSYAH